MLLSSWAVATGPHTSGRMTVSPGGGGTVIGLSIGRERRPAKLSGEPHSQLHGFVPGPACVLKIHDMACKADRNGIKMEEISTLLELLPAACGCDDVSPRRKQRIPKESVSSPSRASSHQIVLKIYRRQYRWCFLRSRDGRSALYHNTIAHAVTSTPGRELTGPVQPQARTRAYL